jgi:ABC-type lipoprotein export system ATPase subunit
MSDVTFVVATDDPEVASCTDRVIRVRDGRLVPDQRALAVAGRLPRG